MKQVGHPTLIEFGEAASRVLFAVLTKIRKITIAIKHRLWKYSK